MQNENEDFGWWTGLLYWQNSRPAHEAGVFRDLKVIRHKFHFLIKITTVLKLLRAEAKRLKTSEKQRGVVIRFTLQMRWEQNSGPTRGRKLVEHTRSLNWKPPQHRSLQTKSQKPNLHSAILVEHVNGFKQTLRGTYLVVQRLRLHVPNAGRLGLISGQGTRPCMLQLRVHIPQLKDLTCWNKVPRAHVLQPRPGLAT